MTDSTEPNYPTVIAHAANELEGELLSSQLFDLGALGVEERNPQTMTAFSDNSSPSTQSPFQIQLVAHFNSETEAQHAIDSMPMSAAPELQFIVGDQWKDEWRKFFKTIVIGKRLVVRPSWEPYEASQGQKVLTLDPGHAFGSGGHETTHLVLEVIEQQLKGTPTVLDIGCGSGILSIAALLLGATSAHATDIDQDALDVTRDNANLNNVQDPLTIAPIQQSYAAHDWVLANIEAKTLKEIRNILIPAVKNPGGHLVLSGVLVEQSAEVAQHFAALGRPTITTRNQWCALHWSV